MSIELIKAAQRKLLVWPDGIWGPQTHDAFLRYNPADVAPVADNDNPPWVTELLKVFGWHEVHDNVRLRSWLKSDNKTLGDPQELPWCGDAVETAVKLALPAEPFTGNLGINPYWARNWTGFGRAAVGYGAVGVFERGPTSGHVGFLVGHDDTCYHVLGGNQGDRVSVMRLEKGRLLGSRWPVTYTIDPQPLPRRATTVAISVNEV